MEIFAEIYGDGIAGFARSRVNRGVVVENRPPRTAAPKKQNEERTAA